MADGAASERWLARFEARSSIECRFTRRAAGPTERDDAEVPVTEIFVDGDACPVKDEVYDVSARLGLAVVVVANQRIGVPRDLGVEMVVVSEGPDAADDWIAAEIRACDIVVTADIPLAARCLERGAYALGTDGREFSPDSIGGALATRDLKAFVRETGGATRGPSPLSARDRSRFSGELDRIAHRAMRGLRPGEP